MNVNHLIKRAYQRAIVRSKRHTLKYDKTKKFDFEDETLRICRNLIHCSSVELLVCPDTNRRFIIYDSMQIKIIIKDDRIILSNHTYYYELKVSENGLAAINMIFDGHIRTRRDTLESQITQNAKGTLINIASMSSSLTY